MPQMSMSAIRIADPVLTNIVLGYKNSAYIGDALFPTVTVAKRAGLYPVFGKDDFTLFNTRRSPGAATLRSNVTYSSQSYSLYQDAMEGYVEVELVEENAGIPINLRTEAAKFAKDKLDLRLEYDQAKLAQDAANYDSNHKVTLSGTDQWTNSASNPVSDLQDWKEAIRSTVGVYPNTMVITPSVFNALQENTRMRDQLKYTSSAVITTGMMQSMLEIPKIVVGSALYQSGDGVLTNIWDAGKVVLAYVAQGSQTNRNPSYGYTFTLQGYPVAEQEYYDNNRRTWYFPVFAERAPVITGFTSGFLASGVV